MARKVRTITTLNASKANAHTGSRDARPVFEILYRRYSDTHPSFLRVRADNSEDAVSALTEHVGNQHYVITSIRTK